jgi:hypothetical protein
MRTVAYRVSTDLLSAAVCDLRPSSDVSKLLFCVCPESGCVLRRKCCNYSELERVEADCLGVVGWNFYNRICVYDLLKHTPPPAGGDAVSVVVGGCTVHLSLPPWQQHSRCGCRWEWARGMSRVAGSLGPRQLLQPAQK